MKRARQYAQRLFWEESGQDMIEYALLSGFLAVSVGATFPDIAHQISHIFDHVRDVLKRAARGGRNG